MPSKNMLRKGGRRQSVRAEYRATRGVETEPAAIVPVLDLDEDTEIEDGVRSLEADAAAAGLRLDVYLAQAIPEISRLRRGKLPALTGVPIGNSETRAPREPISMASSRFLAG